MTVQEVMNKINELEKIDDLLDLDYRHKSEDDGYGGFDIRVPSEAIKKVRDNLNDYKSLLCALKVVDI